MEVGQVLWTLTTKTAEHTCCQHAPVHPDVHEFDVQKTLQTSIKLAASTMQTQL